MWKCKHCGQEFNFKTPSEKANHSRWCDKNPKRKEYANALEKARNAKKEFGNQFTKAKKEGIVLKHSEETKEKIRKGNTGKKLSEETKEKLSKIALKQTHRRLKKNVIKYTKPNGEVILLDSSWEEVLARRLDELEITWERPEPIKWVDKEGTEHNYFPDFYLNDYDVYLDPKNKHAFNVQKEKINILNKTYDNIIWIKTKEDCQNFKISR